MPCLCVSPLSGFSSPTLRRPHLSSPPAYRICCLLTLVHLQSARFPRRCPEAVKNSTASGLSLKPITTNAVCSLGHRRRLNPLSYCCVGGNLCLPGTAGNDFSLSPFAPENLVSQDGFCSLAPREAAHLHTQAESGAYLLRGFSRFPRRRPFIYLNRHMPSASPASLSGHALLAYRWRSLPREHVVLR